MYVTIIKEKKAMNLKDSKEGYMVYGRGWRSMGKGEIM